MGNLTRFDIASIARQHEIPAFLETGTFKGASVNHVLSLNCFALIQSVESSPKHQAEITVAPSNGAIYVLWHGYSEYCLTPMLSLMYNKPCLFWLDAHLPTFYGEPSTGHDLPLKKELEIIFSSFERNPLKDAFIIDDLRLFETGPFQSGNITDQDWEIWGVEPPPRNGWLEKFFHGHKLIRSYEDEGYLLALPV